MKTDKELKEIALGINAGTIFTDRNIVDPEMLPSVFMIFAFMDNKDRKKLVDSKPGMIFEHMSAAGPICVNGYPTFLSMKILTHDETEKVIDYYQKIEEAIEKL